MSPAELDLTALRSRIERAKGQPGAPGLAGMLALDVLALLDRLEAAEATVSRVSEVRDRYFIQGGHLCGDSPEHCGNCVGDELADELTRDPARDTLMLDSANSTPSGFDIKMHAGGPDTQATLIFIADSMRSALDDANAPNYLEMQLRASDGKHYVMTLQRQGGALTPHGARMEAEATIQRVRALATELRNAPPNGARATAADVISALDGE